MSKFDNERPCTVEELDNILTAPSNGMSMCPSDAYNEVYEGIYIGEGYVNRIVLEKIFPIHVSVVE